MPKPATLKKYGLSEYEFHYILNVRQEGLCPICRTKPSRPVIDHEHVRGWKKMKPEKRKTYVRGITCWTCNWAFLRKGITHERAAYLADYLAAYARLSR